MAHSVVYGFFAVRDAGGQQITEFRNACGIGGKALFLHIRQHQSQRDFHLPQQRAHFLFLQLLFQHPGHGRQQRRFPGLFRRFALRDDHAVLLAQPGQGIVGGQGIEQIACQGGVH